MRLTHRFFLCLSLFSLNAAFGQLDDKEYDLLLKGGHVIDGKNGINAIRDVAVKDGKVAAVGTNIAASKALKTVDISGLYVTPGLVDIHVHVYQGTVRNSYANGDNSLFPESTSAVPGSAALRERTRTLIAANLDQMLPDYLKNE